MSSGVFFSSPPLKVIINFNHKMGIGSPAPKGFSVFKSNKIKITGHRYSRLLVYCDFVVFYPVRVRIISTLGSRRARGRPNVTPDDDNYYDINFLILNWKFSFTTRLAKKTARVTRDTHRTTVGEQLKSEITIRLSRLVTSPVPCAVTTAKPNFSA